MMSTNNVLHNEKYASKVLELTQDTMFFVKGDGVCLDFKPNSPDFYLKESDVLNKNLFDFFPIEASIGLRKQVERVMESGESEPANYEFSVGNDVKFFKCIVSKFDNDHFIMQYRDITERSINKLKLQRQEQHLKEVEKAAHIGLLLYDSLEQQVHFTGYAGFFGQQEDVKKMCPLASCIKMIHEQDQRNFEDWLNSQVNGEEDRQDEFSFRMVVGDKMMNVRMKVFGRDETDDRVILEGYLQNVSEIVWRSEHNSELKSAFLANMSHEIRTPLNAVMGFSRIIAESDNALERSKYFEIVERNNMRLQELINEILDLSKLESGMMEFHYAPVNLYTLCEDVQSTYQFRCQNDVELIFDPGCDRSLYINTDRNRLFQVFSNLIGNATKYTHHGHISFGFKKENDQIVFHVSDTGSGIASDKLAKIFDRFVMASERVQGTGLGLSISKIIVEKLGGKIWVDSRVDLGTTFTFAIPYMAVDGHGVDVYEVNRSQRRPATQNDDRLKGKKILVAEDDLSNYTLITAIIGKHYKVIHAKDGMEAISFFEQYKPDIVLMDIKMPNIDGLDATRAIREMSPHTPIIAVSAYAYAEDKQAARDSGCNDFLTKPVSGDVLRSAINKYLKLESEQ
jgi:signal transduction histidine kinase/CheY-like chemotaxis protein